VYHRSICRVISGYLAFIPIPLLLLLLKSLILLWKSRWLLNHQALAFYKWALHLPADTFFLDNVCCLTSSSIKPELTKRPLAILLLIMGKPSFQRLITFEGRHHGSAVLSFLDTTDLQTSNFWYCSEWPHQKSAWWSHSIRAFKLANVSWL